MTRRNFMATLLAAAVAPAFVRAGSLMVPRRTIWTPTSMLPYSRVRLVESRFTTGLMLYQHRAAIDGGVLDFSTDDNNPRKILEGLRITLPSGADVRLETAGMMEVNGPYKR